MKDLHIIPSRPIPLSQRQQMRRALLKMKPGESFIWHCNHAPYVVAKKAGLHIATRKVNGGYEVYMVGKIKKCG